MMDSPLWGLPLLLILIQAWLFFMRSRPEPGRFPDRPCTWERCMADARAGLDRGDLATAISCARQALTLVDETEAGVRAAVQSLVLLGSLELRTGRIADARGHLTELQARIDAGYPGLVSHPGSDLHEMLAELEVLDGRAAAAETHLRAAVRIEEKIVGPHSPNLRSALLHLAELYRRRYRFDRAEAMLERLRALRYEDPAAQARAEREARLELGSLELQRDNPTAAEAHFAAVRAELEVAVEAMAEPLRLGASLLGQSEVHFRAGRLAEAEELAERALELRERLDGADHPGLLPILDARARIHARSGRLEEAAAVRQRILALTENAFGPESPRLAGPLEEMADLMVRQERADEALPFIERASRVLWRAGGPDQPPLPSLLQKQAALLDRAGYRLQGSAAQGTSSGIARRLNHRWDGN